jgi:hypothetical protein
VSEYVRPVLPKQVFYDAEGNIIDYGNRWRGQLPPDDTYSVDSHPERFAPLHTVADALIQHLRDTYAVTVSEEVALVSDLIGTPDDVVRAVRVTPANADGAPLTFVFTSYPGITVHAGLLHDSGFPAAAATPVTNPRKPPRVTWNRLFCPSPKGATLRALPPASL